MTEVHLQPASHISICFEAEPIYETRSNQNGENKWIFNFPRYPGNIIAPFGPDDYFMNNRLECLNTRPEVRFYFALYRDAVAEQNPDLAYFRYWTLLESIARGKGFKKGDQGVTRLLREHEKKFNVEMGLTTNGRRFTAERFIEVWAARRNIAAHFGAFDPNNIRQRSEKRSFEIAASAIDEIRSQQSEFYLEHLKSVARMFLHALLLGQ